jgi:hypothetical protein
MLNGNKKTINNTSTAFNEVINTTLNELNIRAVGNEMFFIPLVKTINSIRVPSIPFNCKTGKPLFMGDLIEISYPDNECATKEIYMVSMKDGQYIGINQNPNNEQALWLFDESMITVLGSSLASPGLLSLLKY